MGLSAFLASQAAVARRRLALVVGHGTALFCLAGLTGCAAAFLQTDDFPAKLQAGCSSEEHCHRLVAEAKGRTARCQANTIGYIRCSDAQADLEIARALLEEKVRQREEIEKRKAAAEQEEREREREEQEEAREEERRRREAQERSERTQKQTERDILADELWETIDAKKCSEQADRLQCAAIAEYVQSFPNGAHAVEARIALRMGREVAAQEEERREMRRNATEHAAEPKSRGDVPKPKRAKCCDGSFDASCGCEEKPGCCFRRGGVCGCE